MNEMAPELATITEDGKRYVLTIDPETGEEVKVELHPIDGEFSQEATEDEITIH